VLGVGEGSIARKPGKHGEDCNPASRAFGIVGPQSPSRLDQVKVNLFGVPEAVWVSNLYETRSLIYIYRESVSHEGKKQQHERKKSSLPAFKRTEKISFLGAEHSSLVSLAARL